MSTDEMSGIQALERLHETLASIPGQLCHNVLVEPGFDLPQVGRLPGNGHPILKTGKPSAEPIGELFIELLLRAIAQVMANDF